MIPPKDIGCHRTGFQKTCFECVTEHKCRLWSHIIGLDPNTGLEVNFYGCADEVRNKLIMEGTQQTRQTGAALETLRNAFVNAEKMHLRMIGTISQASGHPMIEGEANGTNLIESD